MIWYISSHIQALFIFDACNKPIGHFKIPEVFQNANDDNMISQLCQDTPESQEEGKNATMLDF